jgi:hypothetical protein
VSERDSIEDKRHLRRLSSSHSTGWLRTWQTVAFPCNVWKIVVNGGSKPPNLSVLRFSTWRRCRERWLCSGQNTSGATVEWSQRGSPGVWRRGCWLGLPVSTCRFDPSSRQMQINVGCVPRPKSLAVTRGSAEIGDEPFGRDHRPQDRDDEGATEREQSLELDATSPELGGHGLQEVEARIRRNRGA